MPRINVQYSLALPPVSAAAVLPDCLRAIRTLRVELRDIHLPDVGYVAVPIVLEAGSPRAETPSVFPVTIRAERNANAFPAFEGQVGADAVGPSSSTLFVAGEYTAPMHAFGSLLDQTLLASVANRALANFLEELAQCVQQRGTQRELDDARSRRMS